MVKNFTTTFLGLIEFYNLDLSLYKESDFSLQRWMISSNLHNLIRIKQTCPLLYSYFCWFLLMAPLVGRKSNSVLSVAGREMGVPRQANRYYSKADMEGLTYSASPGLS